MLSFSLIPESLLALVLHASLSLGQPEPQSQTLALNQTQSFLTVSSSSSTSGGGNTIFTLPRTTSPLFVSLSLCSAPQGDPHFFVTNNSQVSDPGAQTAEEDVFEIKLDGAGFGSFTFDAAPDGGAFGVQAGVGVESLEIGVSDTDTIHRQLSSLPLFGDTTSNQALLFSPPYLAPGVPTPTYPNYTLPAANLTTPSLPEGGGAVPNFTLVMGPTTDFPVFNASANNATDGQPLTACALRGLAGALVSVNATNMQESVVFRGDGEGFRTQWLVEGLTPSTNYTAYVIEGQGQVSGPIYFTTKSASFSCPLVHSLPFCPLTSYAMPLPAPPGTASSYDASNFPADVAGPLISYIGNFTTSLLTFPCGRDWYSPIVSCADCQAAYRTWLCAVQLPRCGEFASTSTSSTTSSTPSAKRKRADSGDAQTPLSVPQPALAEQNTNSTDAARNPALPAFPSGQWTALLPCLETCNAAERACPNFVGFKCPVPRFNAQGSYGVGFVDGDAESPGGEWKQGGGYTGAAQDRWGSVWCNGPGLNA